jgi:group I intron endonuclease
MRKFSHIENGSGVYIIRNILNNKVYVGSTGDFVSRRYTHFSDLDRNKHKSSHLQYAYNLYGKENFIFEILLYLDNDVNILLFFEEQIIKAYDATNREHGYNTKSIPNSAKGQIMSQETKDKISSSLLGRTPWNKGLKTSEETKKKQRNALLGKSAYWNIGRQKTSEEIEKSRKKNIENGHSKGSNNPMSKLTEMDVLEIKKSIKRGTKDKELSILFGVCVPIINEIRNGKRWTHVQLNEEEDNE